MFPSVYFDTLLSGITSGEKRNLESLPQRSNQRPEVAFPREHFEVAFLLKRGLPCYWRGAGHATHCH